ncbi:hypothetical protein BGZ51_006427 [Haplosporangium sp. Z 767]|nr:hypothetical protein BGZ51_006427 [Haplosporangium sp. Z 767]
MSTRSDVMDLDSRPLEAHQSKIHHYGLHVDVDQLERQRLYQQQLQQMQQQQQQHDGHQQEQSYPPFQQSQHQQHPYPPFPQPQLQQPYPPFPQPHRPPHSQGQQQQYYQQHGDSQQPYPYQQQQQQQQHSRHYPPGQNYSNQNNQTQSAWQSNDNCQLMTPSSGRSVETEMPSLAFSDGNSTSYATHLARQSPHLGPPSPSPSLSPQAADSAESADDDYFLTSVLNMIAPTGIPPVAHYDYLSEFTQRQRIAKGGNGEIRRAYWPLHQCTVILKSLIDTKHTPAQIAKLFDKEVEVMNQCRQHDNIVQFYGVGIRNTADERNGERFMIMQYYELGDLVKLLQIPQQSPEAPSLNDKLYLALDVAQGLEHLFQCGFHHGDLHPKNILIDHRRDRAPQQGRYQARLTDFGLRRIRDNKNAFSSQQFGGVWQFMAPERMSKNRPRYDIRCDIFALGVVYWFIMAGRYPFKDPSTFSPGAREGRVDGTPDWYYSVYTQAWSEDPNARQQSLREIVQVFWHNLGIQTPTSQYLNPNYTRTQYASPTYGYEASMSPSMQPYEGQSHQDSGASGGAFSIRGSPMLTPASMLTPTSFNGRASPHPPSPMLMNMTPQPVSARRPSNANPSYYGQNLSPHGC